MQSDSDRKTDETPEGARRRKSKPPIIDLTATEVTPPPSVEAPAQPDAPVAADTPPAESAEATTPSPVEPTEQTAGADTAPSMEAAAGPDGTAAPDQADPPAQDAAPTDAPIEGPVLTDPLPKADPKPATSDSQPGSGFAAALVGALLGGAIALGGAYGLIASDLLTLPNPQPPQTQASAIDLTPIQAELDKLAGRLDALNGSGAASPLDQRVASLEEALKAAPVGPGSDVAALRKAVDDLTARVSSTQAGAPDVKPELDAIKTDLAALKAAPPAVAPERVAALEGRLASLSDKLDAAAAASTALAERVSTIEARLAAGPKGGEIAALSLAVTSLSSKIASGASFEPEFALVAAAVPDLPDLDSLKPLAAIGVPTQDQLLASLPKEAMAAARPVDAGNGVIEGLMSSAKSLVNYRETGSGTTDPLSQSIEAIVTALKAGDYPAAAAAADQLPAWAKPAAAEWRQSLDARVAADRTVAALTARVLKRLQSPAEGQ
ncbi:hypothetical protein [Oryzibacter oryziterrae]|uniref:hypothetical protein n=1 Tax=Oryzibacter oryziterrae TaxID=2766474 RepID=UPI001F43275E|nr:hypothetical protein [Oryzibacter oryziterrae]